ncbi:MAG TPA: hypothetical protein VMN77_12335 [Nitrospiria bacterium]|jgi:hypothetical protein|nr:hypothetical protein [Nitrospiria bacterium]
MAILRKNKMRPRTGGEEIKHMHCPHMIHHDNSCDVVEPRYSPSEFETDEYCATEQHLRCPLYQDYLLKAIGSFLSLRPRTAPQAKLIDIK